MSIIFVDADKLDNINQNKFEIKGKDKFEKARNLAEQYMKLRGSVIKDYKVVTNYKQITPEIVNQMENCTRVNHEYFEKMLRPGYIVYDINNDIELPFDYFLKQDGMLKTEGKDFCEQILQCECSVRTSVLFKRYSKKEKYKKADLVEDICLLHSASNICQELKKSEEEELKSETVRKAINRIEAKLKEVLKINWDGVKENKEQEFEKLQILGFLYYISHIGIKSGNEYRKINFFDIINKPSKHMIVDNHAIPYERVDAASDIEFITFCIARNIEYKKIKEIRKTVRWGINWYDNVFKYLSNIQPQGYRKEIVQKEQELFRESLFVCEHALSNAIDKIKEEKYTGSLWELLYQKMQLYFHECQERQSIQEMENILSMGKPDEIAYIDYLKTNKLEILDTDIAVNDICGFIEENQEQWIKEGLFPETCDELWFESNKVRVLKLYEMLRRYKDFAMQACSKFMIFSMLKTLYEVQEKKLKYNNAHKGYEGNKEISLLQQLDNITEENVECYSKGNWIIYLKRQFHYHDGNYEVWEESVKLEIAIKRLLISTFGIPKLFDIELFVAGFNTEFSIVLGQTMCRSDAKKMYENSFKKITGFQLEICDYKIIPAFAQNNDDAWNVFVKIMVEVVLPRRNIYKQGVRRCFVIEPKNISIDISFLNDNQIRIENLKYLSYNNLKKMTKRARELKLPWFEDRFDYR